MKKIVLLLFGIVIIGCGSQKRNSQANIEYKIKRLTILNGIDTTYVNELQFHNSKSGYDAYAMMYENYGDYNERMMGKYQSNMHRIIWRDVRLLDDNRKFTVIADGLQRRHPPFSSLMVFDEQDMDCFENGYPLKEELMLLFSKKIKEVSQKSIEPFIDNFFPNPEYRETIHEYRGKYDDDTYESILANLKENLDSNISSEKPIFITYNQKGEQCFLSEEFNDDATSLLKRKVQLATKVCKKYKAQNYHVYERNTALFEFYAQNENFKLDNGYFYENIFDVHENCGAFLIIKPDGSFMKYYGEDYYSLVENFLKKK